MENVHRQPIDHEGLLAAVRAEAESAGEKRLTMDRFLAASGLRERDVFKHYSRWNELLQAAGCSESRKPIESEAMLGDWGEAVRKLGRAVRTRGVRRPRQI